MRQVSPLPRINSFTSKNLVLLIIIINQYHPVRVEVLKQCSVYLTHLCMVMMVMVAMHGVVRVVLMVVMLVVMKAALGAEGLRVWS